MDMQDAAAAAAEETGKFYFVGDEVTVNTLPAIALLAVSSICE